MLTEIDVRTIAVALWPRLIRGLSSRAGLFGHHTDIANGQRCSFVLSVLLKHTTQLFEEMAAAANNNNNDYEGWFVYAGDKNNKNNNNKMMNKNMHCCAIL